MSLKTMFFQTCLMFALSGMPCSPLLNSQTSVPSKLSADITPPRNFLTLPNRFAHYNLCDNTLPCFFLPLLHLSHHTVMCVCISTTGLWPSGTQRLCFIYFCLHAPRHSSPHIVYRVLNAFWMLTDELANELANIPINVIYLCTQKHTQF